MSLIKLEFLFKTFSTSVFSFERKLDFCYLLRIYAWSLCHFFELAIMTGAELAREGTEVEGATRSAIYKQEVKSSLLFASPSVV